MLFSFLLPMVSFLVASVSSAQTSSESRPRIERPPQFVVMAFDGSYAETAWKDTLEAGDAMGVKFTYFISGVYFLRSDRRSLYVPPHRAPGSSDIGFGGTSAEIEARMAQVLLARAKGHEIASHANGHFDGSKWTEQQWDHENLQFDRLIRDTLKLNSLQSSLEKLWAWPEPIAIGFRAPYLAHSPGLRPSLKKLRYLYDTSQIATWNYWPQKLEGVWNFPLASLEISGSRKRTLSMDYNFYVAHSGGKNRPEDTLLFERETLETYLNYFQKNYNGPRAPIHIGHHFSYWNGGAYWRALQKFASATCRLPEVRCVTYAELTSWMDRAEARKAGDPKGTLEDLRKMAFAPTSETVSFKVSEEKQTVVFETKLQMSPTIAVHQQFGSEPGRVLSPREIKSLGLRLDHGRLH